MAAACADCGDPATRTYDEGAEYAFWTDQPQLTLVCESCWHARDNRDGTYEGPTFDEALAFRCDEQERLEQARRLK